jgi:small subunit ribosomal protein S11
LTLWDSLHVHSSFNNIIVSLANSEGQIISWSSAGKMGFRGSKKNTPYAAQMAAEDCAKVAFDLGLRKVKLTLKVQVMVVSQLSAPSTAQV